MLAALTLQANIRTEAYHGPLVRAAWMGLAQAQVVFQLQIWKHGWDYTAAYRVDDRRQNTTIDD